MFLLHALDALIGFATALRRRPLLGQSRPLLLEVLEGRFCPSGGYLLVSSFNNNSLLRYDEHTGAFVDQFDPHNLGNLKTPDGGVFGPDHNLYVSSGVFQGNQQSVLQYNGTTGAFQSVFASQNITSPRGELFGPDGNLYVANGNDAASGDPASVERFDGKTGAFLNYFVTPSSGGLEHPSYMVFGPDGTKDGKLDLYVAATHVGSILRYDGTTGAFKSVFVSAGSGGLDAPQGMVFGPDGNLYIASANWFTSSNGPLYTGDFPPGAVLRFEGPSGPNPGALLGTFIPGGSGGLANPDDLLFAPDPSGNGKTNLYVDSSALTKGLIAEGRSSQVLRYDATTGAFRGVFVTPDSGGLKFPFFMTFTETDPTTLNYVGSGQGSPERATRGTFRAQRAASPSTGDWVGAMALVTGALGGVGLTSLPSAVSVTPPPPAQPASPSSFLPPTPGNGPQQTGAASSPAWAPAARHATRDHLFARLGAGQLFDLLGDDLVLTGLK